MNEIEMALLRHEKRKAKVNLIKEDKKLSHGFTKILLSIILVLISTIYINMNSQNLETFKSYLFEDNLAFTKINQWYQKFFGNILPTVSEPKEEIVSSDKPLESIRTPYHEGYQISVDASTPIKAYSGGILVFMGEKENYGNTFIIQGADGVDIWYGNITDTNLKLYDYVDANSIIGVSKGESYYVVFKKDGIALQYEEYFNQISS